MGFFTNLFHALLDDSDDDRDGYYDSDDDGVRSLGYYDGVEMFQRGSLEDGLMETYSSFEIPESLASSLFDAVLTHPDAPMIARGEEICKSFSEDEWIGFYTYFEALWEIEKGYAWRKEMGIEFEEVMAKIESSEELSLDEQRFSYRLQNEMMGARMMDSLSKYDFDCLYKITSELVDWTVIPVFYYNLLRAESS